MAESTMPLSKKGSSSFRELIKNRNFLKLWISQICSQFSTRMITLALIISVFQTTKSNTLVVLLVFAFAIPALIFGLPAGAYVDRHSRKHVLIWTNILQATLMLFFLATQQMIWLVLLIIFIYASINQLYIPAETSMIPHIVSDKNLLGANSLFMFTVYGSFIFGYGAAGPVMLLFGNNAPYILAFILLFIAFLSSLFLPSDAHKFKPVAMKKIYIGILKELKHTYEFIKGKAVIWQSILRLTIIQAIIGALAVLIPAFSDRVLHMDVRTASVLFITPVGIGTVLGALLISKISKKYDVNKLVKRVIIADGITIGLMGAAYPLGQFLKNYFNLTFLNHGALLIFIGTLVTLLGIESAMIIVASQTELQRQTPFDIRGRVFAVFGIFVTVTALLPMLFMGALADFLSVTTVFILGGILIIAYGIFSKTKVEA
jgi:MFS family permease